MGLVLLESGQMKLFIIAAVVSEEASVVLKGKLQLISVTPAQILRIPRGHDIKPVWTQQLSDEDRNILVKVEPDEERRLRYLIRASIWSSGTRLRLISASIASRCSW